MQTVQGPGHFQNAKGENTKAQGSAFIFQWQNSQFLQVLPTHPGLPWRGEKPDWGFDPAGSSLRTRPGNTTS